MVYCGVILQGPRDSVLHNLRNVDWILSVCNFPSDSSVLTSSPKLMIYLQYDLMTTLLHTDEASVKHYATCFVSFTSIFAVRFLCNM